ALIAGGLVSLLLLWGLAPLLKRTRWGWLSALARALLFAMAFSWAGAIVGAVSRDVAVRGLANYGYLGPVPEGRGRASYLAPEFCLAGAALGACLGLACAVFAVRAGSRGPGA